MYIQVPLQPMGNWDKALITDFWQAKTNTNEEFNTVDILNAKYDIPGLIDVSQAQTHMCPKEKTDLKNLLLDYNELFQPPPQVNGRANPSKST